MTNARDKANIPVLNFQSKGIDDNADATAITIDSSERVGIGTTSPASLLHVTSSTGDNKIQLTNSSSSDGSVNSGASIQLNGTSLIVNNNEASGDIFFRTDGFTERLRISSAGLVGIGTSAPNAKLDVRGSAIFNEDGADVDFRVESDTDTSAIYMDGTDGRVKIGSGAGTGGTGKFNVSANGFSTSHSNAHIVMTNGNNTAGDKALIMGEVTSSGGVRYRPVAFGIENTQATTREGAFVVYVSDNQYVDLSTDERFRITNDGFVGIRTSAPSANLEVRGASSNGQIYLGGSTTATYGKLYSDNDGTLIASADGGNNASGSSFRVEVDGSEKMRITSAGNIGINRTSVDTGVMLDISHPGSSKYALKCDSSETSGTQYHIIFSRNGGTAGYITSNSATTIAFNNASDERLKENIENSNSAIQDIKDLKVRQFDWKDNIDTHRDFGFVAQELHSIIPEAVSVGSDELDDNGKPVRSWGVDYSHIVPRLVKAVQEQQTKIESLEAEVTALKNQP